MSRLVVRRPYLESNPDVVRSYLQAHIEAVETIRRDKELAKRLLGKGTNSEDAELLEFSSAGAAPLELSLARVYSFRRP